MFKDLKMSMVREQIEKLRREMETKQESSGHSRTENCNILN